MPHQAYLRLSGIDGPVVAPPKYQKWIKVYSFTWGGISSGSQGVGSSKIGNVKDFSISKAFDQTSPELFQKLANGHHLAEVKLDFTKTDGRVLTKYLEYIFTDVSVSRIWPGADENDIPHEEVTFNFAKATYKYTNG